MLEVIFATSPLQHDDHDCRRRVGLWRLRQQIPGAFALGVVVALMLRESHSAGEAT